jgi:ergothioneine biosynthesis protein EgtB
MGRQQQAGTRNPPQQIHGRHAFCSSRLFCKESRMESVQHRDGIDALTAAMGSSSLTYLAARFRQVRGLTASLCAPLDVEDYGVQSMPEASPAKWHLAHTTWFFETFVLADALPDYQPYHPTFRYLFNSYYEAVGERLPRARRGLLSRPSVAEVYRYRQQVDDRVLTLLDQADSRLAHSLAAALVLGFHHEQQHQELLLTDIKHAFACNPMRPVYREAQVPQANSTRSLGWMHHRAGVSAIGHSGDGFAFDNESPRHKTYLGAFSLADRLVTNQEYLAFMEDDGYQRPDLWLSDGWQARNANGWTSPLYWDRDRSGWNITTLAGLRKLNPAEPVCHLSYYESDAYARWAGARLPTEAEWEVAANQVPVAGNLLGTGNLHPISAKAADGVAQFFGDAWEWTGSAYTPYPGYRPASGALGEYNGKFMCNQMVLRGGSCVTPEDHIRASYRNFFPPETRWQFTGIRLAKDV